MVELAPTLEVETLWRVLVEALDRLPDAELVDREDWIQLRAPSSPHSNHNRVLRARMTAAEADARIAEIRDEHRARGAGLIWVVDDRSTPADLSERLSAAGIAKVADTLGMARRVEAPRRERAGPAGLRIEPATAADIEALGDLAARAWDQWANPGRFRDSAVSWLSRVFASGRDDLRVWQAHLDGELVASANLRVIEELGVGYLQGAAVLPQARGRGVYTALTQLRMDELHRRRVEHVVIWASATSSAPIVRKLGFRELASAPFHELSVPRVSAR